MSEGIILNQRDNINYPYLGARRQPFYANSQCCLTGHASGLYNAMQAHGMESPWKHPNAIEDYLAQVIDSQADKTDAEVAASLGISLNDNFQIMLDYKGNPISCNANWLALQEICTNGLGRPLMALDESTMEGLKYIDGIPRLVENGANTEAEMKDLFRRLWSVMGPADFMVCLTLPFSCGHYRTVLRVDDDGVLFGDPYGTPNPGGHGYAQRNALSDPYGMKIKQTWHQCTRDWNRPASRINVVRFA